MKRLWFRVFLISGMIFAGFNAEAKLTKEERKKKELNEFVCQCRQYRQTLDDFMRGPHSQNIENMRQHVQVTLDDFEPIAGEVSCTNKYSHDKEGECIFAETYMRSKFPKH